MDRYIRFVRDLVGDDGAIYLFVMAAIIVKSVLVSVIHAILTLNLTGNDVLYGIFIVDTTFIFTSFTCLGMLVMFTWKKTYKRDIETQTAPDEAETQLEQRTTTGHSRNYLSTEYSSLRNEVFTSTLTHPANSYELTPVRPKPNATILKEQKEEDPLPIYHTVHSSSSVRNEFFGSDATYPIDSYELPTRHLQTNAIHFEENELQESSFDEPISNMIDSIKKLFGSSKTYTLQLDEQKSKYQEISRSYGSPDSKYIKKEFIPYAATIRDKCQDFRGRQLSFSRKVDESSELIPLSLYSQQEPVRNQFYSQPGGRENFVSHSGSIHISDQTHSQTITQSHSEITCKRQILATSAANSSSLRRPKQMCVKHHQFLAFKEDSLVSGAPHMPTTKENPSSNQDHNQCHPRCSPTIPKRNMFGTTRDQLTLGEENSASNGNENQCNSNISKKVLPEAKVRLLPGKTFSNFDGIHNTPGTSQEPLGKVLPTLERANITSSEENSSHHDFHRNPRPSSKSLPLQKKTRDIPEPPSLTMDENLPSNRDRIQNSSIPRHNGRSPPNQIDERLRVISHLSRVLYGIGRFSPEINSSLGHSGQLTTTQEMELKPPLIIFKNSPSYNVFVNISLTLTSSEFTHFMENSNFNVCATDV